MTTNDDDVGGSGSWDVMALEELEPVGDSPGDRRRVDGSIMFIPSLVPRPPPFFVLRFAFSIIHGSGRARKMGKAWSHLSRA